LDDKLVAPSVFNNDKPARNAVVKLWIAHLMFERYFQNFLVIKRKESLSKSFQLIGFVRADIILA
jgi:hypothetical protein